MAAVPSDSFLHPLAVRDSFFGNYILLNDSAFSHFLPKHCCSHNPSENRYRQVFLDALGELAITALGKPQTGKWHVSNTQTKPFATALQPLLEEAISNQRYFLYTQIRNSEDPRRVANVVLDNGMIVVLANLKPWLVITLFGPRAYRMDVNATTNRIQAMKELLTTNTYGMPSGRGTLKIPTVTDIVHISNEGVSEIRSDYHFPDLAVWAGKHGYFQMGLIR